MEKKPRSMMLFQLRRSTTALTGQWSEAEPWSAQLRSIQAFCTSAPLSTIT